MKDLLKHPCIDMAHEYYGDGRTRRLEWSGGFFQKVDDEKNLASLREISNFAHNNLLNILKL